MADTIELGPEGSRYRIHDPGGGGRVAKMLRAGHPYEHGVLNDMLSLGIEGGTAVDVGANIANHTLWLALVCKLDVVAIEPRDTALAKLRANLELNGLTDRVPVHAIALGDAEGAAEHIGKGRMKVGSGAVPVRTLDSLDVRDVRLLKIDVEGMEQSVIRGGMETIARDKPVIYAEAWDDDYREATAELLRPLGYSQGPKLRWNQQRWDPV